MASTPTPLSFDSTGAISIAWDPVKHELTKHIGVDASYMRSQVHDQIVALQYVPSSFSLWTSSRRLKKRCSIVIFFPNSVL